MERTRLKKRMMIDDLAIMVAKGFEDVTSRMATKTDVADMATKSDIIKLQKEIESLRGSVNNYLRLSDERYLELKQKYNILVKVVKAVVQKTKIPIDLTPLENI